MSRIPGLPGSRRRRRTFLGLLACTLLTAAIVVPSASAVHDVGAFELDKNAHNDLSTVKVAILNSNVSASATSLSACRVVPANPTTPFTILIDAEEMSVTAVANAGGGGCPTGTQKQTWTVTRAQNGSTAAAHAGGSNITQLITGPVPGDDWDQVFAEVTADPDTKCIDLGAVECSYVHDGVNESIFTTGGSKDDLDIPNWRHTSGSVPDADEINDAMAAKYVVGGEEILYFGADRFATNGAKDFGFWFFHNQVEALPDGTFSGEHTGTLAEPGDILILGTFTNGGATTTVRVFQWVGSGGSDGVLDSNAALGDCVPGSAGDDGCATVNNTTIRSPWQYVGKSTVANNIILSGGFVEGGINLTALGLEGCFSSFMAETRSSPELGAQLKDFILGTFEACGATITTATKDGVNSFEIGGSIQDTATVNVTGGASPPAPTGFVDFYVCGPTDGITSCDATGTAAGHINLNTAVVSGNDYTVTSDVVTPVEAGDYCFYAEYPANQDTNYPSGALLTDFTDECFTVTPAQPAITTQVNDAGPVPLGSVLDDTAHLTGTADQPDGDPAGGTITFNAYGPFDNTTTCTGDPVYTSVVAVSGDGFYTASAGDADGDAIPGEVPDDQFIPTTAGTYNWIASYSGDSPNTLSVSGACGDANEGTVVGPNQPAITTQVNNAGPVPLGSVLDDTAHLTGTAADPDGSNADGTITFNAYGPFDNTTTCTGAAVYTSVVAVDGDGFYTASDGDADGDNVPGEVPDDQFIPTEAGTYNWVASYSGDSPNTLPVSGSCGDANEGTVVISLQPTISTAQYVYPNDTAHIAVATGGGDLAGSITFGLYDSSDCLGSVLFEETFNVPAGAGTEEDFETTNGDGAGVGDAADQKVSADGTYSWLVQYLNTNPAHRDVTSVCHDEHFDITFVNDDPTLPQQI
jgi:hypothetical protein